jgi:ABC-type multidrug transport system permease subunit
VFPPLPSTSELADLAAPLERPAMTPPPRDASVFDHVAITLPPVRLDEIRFDPIPAREESVALPGSLGLAERAASPGARLNVNAFDQYVPGFGITFLLIGMMMGVALTLFDERDWGTFQRLRAGGVPLIGILLGKVAARFVVGVVQMVLLFAVGRWLFAISLGPEPAALLLPTIGVSFAAAALGLVIPSIARSHDSVMPLGTMTSMAMSAMGGCWWPIGFEPAWMQAVARALPTTWAMRAYNDLMIRHAGASAAIRPFVATTALGLLFLAVGLHRHLRPGR